MEKWKLIDKNSTYEISNYGNVRHIKFKKILKLTKDRGGYSRIKIPRKENGLKIFNNKLVHRLVVKAFDNFYNDLLEVDHIDRNRSNNNILNLRMVSRSDNLKYRFKINIYTIKAIIEQYEKGKTTKEIYEIVTAKYGDLM